MGSGDLKFCPHCALHTLPPPFLSSGLPLSLTCRDSEQVVPPFLALQSAGDRHTDLQTDGDKGSDCAFILLRFLS